MSTVEKKYFNPIPVAVLLQPVIRGDKRVGLVVIQRNIEPCKGGLALPAGYIEKEDWRYAAAREGNEEGAIPQDKWEEIRIYDCRNTPDNMRILIFGLASPIKLKDLPPFIPNDETLARRVIYTPEELCFSLHNEVVERFFREKPLRKKRASRSRKSQPAPVSAGVNYASLLQ